RLHEDRPLVRGVLQGVHAHHSLAAARVQTRLGEGAPSERRDLRQTELAGSLGSVSYTHYGQVDADQARPSPSSNPQAGASLSASQIHQRCPGTESDLRGHPLELGRGEETDVLESDGVLGPEGKVSPGATQSLRSRQGRVHG